MIDDNESITSQLTDKLVKVRIQLIRSSATRLTRALNILSLVDLI